MWFMIHGRSFLSHSIHNKIYICTMSFIPMSSTDKRHCPSKLTSSSSNVSLVTSHRTLVSSTSRILKSTSTIAAKSDSHSFLNKKPLNCSGTPKEPAKRISSSSSISTSTTSSSFQSSTASPSSATSNTSTTPSILSFSKISKSTDWNERSKSLESVSEYVNDISNELVSKQKRLQDLFIQGLKDKHPKVVQKTMGVIEDYLKRPDSLPLLMQSRENHIDDDNPSNVTQSIPTALGMEFLGNMLPLILVNSVVMPTNSNRGSIAEAGMNVIFLFKMKFGSKHLCSAITSIINNPHWCENTKISFGCIVLLSILDIGELEIYCRKKTGT